MHPGFTASPLGSTWLTEDMVVEAGYHYVIAIVELIETDETVFVGAIVDGGGHSWEGFSFFLGLNLWFEFMVGRNHGIFYWFILILVARGVGFTAVPQWLNLVVSRSASHGC